ncbi:MAG: MobF family relaxase, partial [Patulibacter sp.]|nr:MobF family relaxase [Patulibacter sp.]
MLKVTKMGLGQQEYFEKSVAKGMDDYYSGKGERPGEWHGRLATELGLEGTVSAAQFNALLAGLDPRDPERLPSLADPKNERKVAAYDLTFSAPKSVSVLAVVSELPVRRELHAAHESAVRAALEFVQDEAARVRRGKGGLTVERAPGIVAAAYRHRMSRAQDPHLHTHVVTAAIAPGKDGRWTALDARPLYRMAKAAGTIYQAHLRAEVGERLGLTWREPVAGLAELEGIDQAVLDEFSKRRQALRKAALEQGLKLDDLTIGKREVLALATREAKQAVDEYPWREGVRARAAEHGLTFQAIEQLVDGRAPIMEAGEGVGETLDQLAGQSGLTHMSTAFERPDAIIGVAGARREGMRAPRVLAATERLLGRGDVFAVHGSQLDPRWTTAELVAAEQRLIADAIGRAGDGSGKLAAQAVERAIDRSDRVPGDEQRAAVIGVTTSGNGVDVIEARAGTGKTFLAGLIREAYEAHGVGVIGTAPTGAAARELTEGAGIRSWTIHALLSEIERFDGLTPGTVVVLDEAGMADTRHAERLLVEARKAGAKVIAIGDSGQLPSVQAGGWLKAVGDQVGRHEITETRRQSDAAERRALGALHAGVPQVWLGFAERSDRLELFNEDEPAIAKAIDTWTAAVAEYGVDEAVLISRDNAMRTLLNAGARQHWDEQGRLGKRVDFGPIELAEGDRVICRRNDARHDVDNGTRGTIRAVHEDHVVLEVKHGVVRELPASYVAEHVEHAYALTGHGMQGSTVKWAGVVATPEHLTRGWSYTALSRAQETTMLFVSDEGPERDPNLEQEGPELAKERDHSTT